MIMEITDVKLTNKVREKQVQKWIDERVRDNDTVNCIFYILLLKEDKKESLDYLLDKYGYTNGKVDTVAGCWNLDDGWYELSDIESMVEYCGVYPVKWDIEDVVLLENLYNSRAIYIKVDYKIENENGDVKYIPNH